MTGLCAKCLAPLVVEVEVDDGDNEDFDMAGSSQTPSQTVPDDVSLPCGDHMHFDCIMEHDSYELTKCPICAQDISTGDSILVDYCNEGGLQKALDILPLLREEAHLRAYPEERKCRAFLELCREGDHTAIVDLIQSCQEPDDEVGGENGGEAPGSSMAASQILRYQDSIGDMQSGLHAAVANGHREVAWLLLLLASEVPEMEFPAIVFQEAAALGVMREDQTGLVDIRSLTDVQGRTAEDIARSSGVIWNGWLGTGRLALPN